MAALDREQVRQTFTTQLLTVSGMAALQTSGRISAENRPIKPPDPKLPSVDDATWVRETMLIVDEIQASTGLIHTPGIMVYDVFTPAGRGTERAESLSKLIAEAFPPASSLQGGGQCVSLYKTERPSGQVDRANSVWYHVPVRVHWRVFTSNP